MAMSPATFLVFATVLPSSTPGSASEVCEYTGRTDYSGTVNVRAEVSSAADRTQVRVALEFTATAAVIFKVDYWSEEISEWRNGELQSVALNSRYMVNHGIIRQQWDYFDRGSDGFAAYRVQAKNAGAFRRRYPAFSRYWNPSTFGQPWLRDYQSARPERRPDLDLKNQVIPSGLRSPFAMAFYWIRRLQPIRQTVPLFLPGNKHQPRLDLSMSAPELQTGGQRVWQVPLHLEAVTTSYSSQARAWVSPDQHLLRITVHVNSDIGSASGLISQVKCEGQ